MARQLTIVIPTAGRTDLLSRTLKSLATVRFPSIYNETIVVENGPKGQAEEIVHAQRSPLNARYEYVEQPGKSNALNVIIEQLDDECLIYFTDDDIRFSANVLDEYVQASEGKGPGWFFGGSMDVDYEKVPPEWLFRYLPLDTRPYTQRDYEHGYPPLVFMGCNWAAFAGDIRLVGGFDTRFGPGGTSGGIGQESEMQERLVHHGTKPQFLPGAVVWHYVPVGRSSPDWLVHRQYRYGILDAIRTRCPTNRFGIPVWQLRKLAPTAVDYMTSRFNGDQERRFVARRDLYFRWGQVIGAWRAAREAGGMRTRPTRPL